MKKAIIGSSVFLPMLASAQLAGVGNLINVLKGFLTPLSQLIFGLAIVYFFWGVAKYILSAGDAKAAAEGRSIMIYGIIAIAVMASVYGLVNFLQATFNVSGGTVSLPVLP